MMGDEAVVKPWPVRLQKYKFFDPRHIPLRDWLMRGLILRKHVTALIAQGGAGKSIFGLAAALHLCAGRSFGPYFCNERFRVAVLTVEEDQDELDRRLHAIQKYFSFTNEDAQNLHLIAIDGAPILAQVDKKGEIHRTQKMQYLEKCLSSAGIDVVVVDPFIEIWNGVENDNSQVKSAAGLLRELARNLEIGCLLMHHVRKGLVTPGDIDAGRGGSSFGGLVRIAATITNMTMEQAATFNLTSPKGIVRIDNAKGNYSAPTEEAYWFKFHSVDLGNGTDGDFNSDHVGVLAPWTPPGLFEGISYQMIDDTLDAIRDGMENGERYTFAGQSKDRYVGLPIAQHCQTTEERATRIMKCWRESGLLYEDQYTGNKSRLKKGVFVDPEKRPSAVPIDD